MISSEISISSSCPITALLELSKKFILFPPFPGVLLAKKLAVEDAADFDDFMLILLTFPCPERFVDEDLKDSKWSSVSMTGLWAGVKDWTIP